MQLQHTLQMFVDHFDPRQSKPRDTIKQGLLQQQGELYPFQTIFNHSNKDHLSFVRVSAKQLAVRSLSKGIPSALIENIGTDGTRTGNLSNAPKASTVSIELSLLLLLFITDS